MVNKGAIKAMNAQIDQLISNAHISKLCSRTLPPFSYAPAHIYIYVRRKKETLWVSGKYIKKNWRAAGLELTTLAPSRTIVTDANC